MCVLCLGIEPLRFLAGCRRRRLNQGLVVALDFSFIVRQDMFCVIFSVYGCMLCLVRNLFVISTSVIDCLGRYFPEITYHVSSGTLNLTKLKHKLSPAQQKMSQKFDSCSAWGCTRCTGVALTHFPGKLRLISPPWVMQVHPLHLYDGDDDDDGGGDRL